MKTVVKSEYYIPLPLWTQKPNVYLTIIVYFHKIINIFLTYYFTWLVDIHFHEKYDFSSIVHNNQINS